MNRRRFIQSSLFTGAVVSWSAKSWASVPGANETIRAGVVGVGGRGKDHIGGMQGLSSQGVKLAALCDVDSKILNATVENVKKKSGDVVGYVDIREMLDNKDLDVITIATPNHWHSLATIWAVQADKDVYVEKPVSHNVFEGRKMVEAARKYKKIVQTGTQSRSSQAIQECIDWVKAGNLGKMKVVRGLCYKPRGSIGNVTSEQSIPEHINYDLWCGPAPKDPLKRARLHYDWHWIWNYGNGDLGNQGIHQMDIARWFLGHQELSPRVFSVGGRLGYSDDGETPNTQMVYHDYDEVPLIFEVRGLTSKAGAKEMDRYPQVNGGSVAVIIECEGGFVNVPNYVSAMAYDKENKEIKRWAGSSDHYKNFIDAVRSRKHTDLKADILQGHLSSALCHTGNVSYRLGKLSSPEVIREKIKADTDALNTFNRLAEHLAANNVDININQVTLGEFLKMNGKKEKFTNNKAANQMLTREYRTPFVVPEKV